MDAVVALLTETEWRPPKIAISATAGWGWQSLPQGRTGSAAAAEAVMPAVVVAAAAGDDCRHHCSPVSVAISEAAIGVAKVGAKAAMIPAAAACLVVAGVVPRQAQPR